MKVWTAESPLAVLLVFVVLILEQYSCSCIGNSGSWKLTSTFIYESDRPFLHHIRPKIFTCISSLKLTFSHVHEFLFLLKLKKWISYSVLDTVIFTNSTAYEFNKWIEGQMSHCSAVDKSKCLLLCCNCNPKIGPGHCTPKTKKFSELF